MTEPDLPSDDGPADRLVAAMRGRGVPLPLDAVLAFHRALAAMGAAPSWAAPWRAYWAGRITLVRSVDHVADYDASFVATFAGGPDHRDAEWPRGATRPEASPSPRAVDRDDLDHDGGADPDGRGRHAAVLRWSAHETLRTLDFGAASDDELADLAPLLRGLRVRHPVRPGRRRRPHRRSAGSEIDLVRTLRQSMTTGGEPVTLRHVARPPVPRRLVFLLDISGSMAPYAEALLRVVHALVADARAHGSGRGAVEAFTFGTRLTRITAALATPDPERALAAVAVAVPDWSGGTRLGDTLRAFNDRWGAGGPARGAVVVVLSDGWDRGDPSVVDAEMARLARVAHRIVWVNPLRGTPGYEPLARGMAAALPHVDRFLAGHDLASMEALVAVIADPRGSRP